MQCVEGGKHFFYFFIFIFLKFRTTTNWWHEP
jgi:hypothetical protein